MTIKPHHRVTDSETIEIGYLRTTATLEKLSVRTLHDYDANEHDREATLVSLEPFVALDRTPIPSMTADPLAKSLLAAWDTLSAVRTPHPEAAKALETILTETVPAASSPAPRPFPFIDLALSEPPKPTAAHPRAFQGTTFKPPKSKISPPIDLRLYLCDRMAISDLTTRFVSPYPFNTDRASSTFHHSMIPDISPVFIAMLYPLVRHQPQAEVAAAHALFQQLALERNEPLLACIIALFARSEHAPAWCATIAQLPPDQQAGFTGLLLETDACQIDPEFAGESFVMIVLEAADGAQAAYRVYCLLLGLSRGVDSCYLIQGFRWNDQFEMSRHFHDISKGGAIPVDIFDAIIAQSIQEGTYSDRWKIMDAWTACGVLNGLTALIESRDWSRWRAGISLSLLALYSAPATHQDAAETETKWRSTYASADDIEATLERIPSEYQSKFLDNLREFIWRTEAEDWGAHSISDACRLLERLCRAPFHRSLDITYIWLDFISYFDADQRAALIAAPDACYRQMEKGGRVSNTANLVARGNWALAKVMPAFTLACFLSAPARLFRTGKALGCLSNAERLSFAEAFASESFMQADVEEMNDRDAYEFIRSQQQDILTQAIPKELIRHYGGVATLSEVRAAHYHALMRRQWLRACLERLENKIYKRLAHGYPIEEWDENTKHALQLQMKAQENRKALKKMLTAHWVGRRNYLIDHPRTREWLKDHPKLNTGVWLTGVTYVRTLAPYGEVTISVEQDPIEALKLGTYVGSCLGLGGSFAFSAAATVLDINKQVLYARDSKGTVVGRQVVAYTESDAIVCFSVYPLSAPDSLRRLFAEYDRELTAALGLSLFQQAGEEEYKIRTILSHGWWDDYADHDKYNKKGAERALTPSP